VVPPKDAFAQEYFIKWIEYFSRWMKYFIHLNEKYFHVEGEKMGRNHMQVLDLLVCGTNERN
jgi:hypothetical protein